MKKTIAIIAIALSLTACTEYEISADTEFQMTSANTFAFKSLATVLAPLDSGKAEGVRMSMLNRYLEANKACPNGYTITERNVTVDPAPLADAYVLRYTGECV